MLAARVGEFDDQAAPVGRAAPVEDYLWTPEPGHFRVRVVDDLGRADAVPVTVASTPTVYGA